MAYLLERVSSSNPNSAPTKSTARQRRRDPGLSSDFLKQLASLSESDIQALFPKTKYDNMTVAERQATLLPGASRKPKAPVADYQPAILLPTAIIQPKVSKAENSDKEPLPVTSSFQQPTSLAVLGSYPPQES